MRWIVVLAFTAQPLLGCVTNVIPFGVTTNVLTGKTVGDTFILNDSGVGGGQYGKIDLKGYQIPAAWYNDMVALGCGCEVCDGAIPVITGNTQVKNAFSAMGTGSVYIIPLVDSVLFNDAVIVGFVLAKELTFNGAGSGWTATLQLLSAPFPLNDLTADSDGDGLSDFQEFYTGTNPTDSRSFLGITSSTNEGDDFRISWTTTPGKTNALERCDSASGVYSNIFSVTNVLNSTTNYLDTGAVTKFSIQFYRLHQIP